MPPTNPFITQPGGYTSYMNDLPPWLADLIAQYLPTQDASTSPVPTPYAPSSSASSSGYHTMPDGSMMSDTTMTGGYESAPDLSRHDRRSMRRDQRQYRRDMRQSEGPVAAPPPYGNQMQSVGGGFPALQPRRRSVFDLYNDMQNRGL